MLINRLCILKGVQHDTEFDDIFDPSDVRKSDVDKFLFLTFLKIDMKYNVYVYLCFK